MPSVMTTTTVGIVRPRDVAAAITTELRRSFPTAALEFLDAPDAAAVHDLRRPEPWVCCTDEAVLVGETGPGTRGEVVAAAVDDDHSPGPILHYAAAGARRLGVPLRAVHVWTAARSFPLGLRHARHDRMSDADQLLADVLYDHLPPGEADAAERQILHDRDPAGALIALSAGAVLLVVGVHGIATSPDVLGATVRSLVGRTSCPLAVLPDTGPAAVPGRGW